MTDIEKENAEALREPVQAENSNPPLPEANPPRGQKGSFIRFTCTLDPLVYQRLAEEATRRKMNKEPNPIISAIIRDALVDYLKLSAPTFTPDKDLPPEVE